MYIFFYKKKFNIKNFSGCIKNFKKNKIINNNKKIINLKKIKNLIIYFGYSQCPDICPKLINKISYLIKYFKFSIKFLFLSIDIKNDNNNISKKYISKSKNNLFISFQINKNLLENYSLNYKIIYYDLSKKYINKIIINHSSSINIIKKNKLMYII